MRCMYQEYARYSGSHKAVSLLCPDQVWVSACTAADSVLLATSAGMVTRFHTDDTQLRPRGRAAGGVTAMRLRPGESLVSA